jgi:hypothetical protein
MLMTNFLYSRCFFEGISEWWSKGAGSFVVSGLQAWSGKMCCEVYLAARSPCLPSLICLRLAFHQSRSCLNKGHQYSVFTILSSNSYRVPILSIQFQSQMWECSDQARLIEYALSVWHYIWRFYVHLPEHKSSLWLELHLCYIRWRHISFHSLHGRHRAQAAASYRDEEEVGDQIPFAVRWGGASTIQFAACRSGAIQRG